jgi:hypothetical protein
MVELKGTIAVKAGNGKGFMITGQEGWFNCADTTILAKFNKGDEVKVVYELNGKIKKVSDILGVVTAIPETKPPAPEVKKETPKPSTTGFACEVCKKELKDGKFKKCYECNVAAKATPAAEELKTDAVTGFKCVDCGVALKDDKYTKCFPCNKKNPVKKQWSGKSKGSYDDSPEKILRIQKGNALNAAASVLCGASCLDGKDADEIAQVTQYLANLLLDYLKQE